MREVRNETRQRPRVGGLNDGARQARDAAMHEDAFSINATTYGNGDLTISVRLLEGGEGPDLHCVGTFRVQRSVGSP